VANDQGLGKMVNKFGLQKENTDGAQINGPDCFELTIDSGNSSPIIGKVYHINDLDLLLF